MKSVLIAVLSILTLANGVGLYSQSMKNMEQDSKQNSVHLLLPPALYAVPGTELNVYFDNIVLVPDIKTISFDVECKYGRQDQERWRFTPEDKDAGNFPLNIKVYDASSSKLLAEASTTVYVSPKDAGKDKNISILLVGDSLTDLAVYPKELFDLFKKGGNPVVKFIGTHSGVGNPEREGFPMIEGYGGWTWEGFCTRCAEKPLNDPAAYRRGSSPFVFLKNGNPIIDFKMYCDKKNEGNAPDYITVFLGINDSFAADDTNIDTAINNILKYADILLTEFRKVGSNTKIGIVITPPPAGTQDAFGENSQCGQTRWQYRKNQHKLVERYLQYFSGREKENLFIIPVYVNIDCVNNYPKREERINARNPKMILRDINAVHPAKEGNFQIADSFYSWFKYELNKK